MIVNTKIAARSPLATKYDRKNARVRALMSVARAISAQVAPKCALALRRRAAAKRHRLCRVFACLHVVLIVQFEQILVVFQY